MNKNRMVMVAVATLLIVIAGVGLILYSNARTGRLNIVLNTPDTHGLQLKLDDKPQKVSNLRPAYDVRHGTYHLTVTKPGYQDFVVDLTVSPHDTTTANVVMPRKTTVPTATFASTVGSDLEVAAADVQGTVYFYDSTWAFAQVRGNNTDDALVVVRYDDTAGRWRIDQGPATSFSGNDLQGVPSDVVKYLRQNNFVTGDNVNEQ